MPSRTSSGVPIRSPLTSPSTGAERQPDAAAEQVGPAQPAGQRAARRPRRGHDRELVRPGGAPLGGEDRHAEAGQLGRQRAAAVSTIARAYAAPGDLPVQQRDGQRGGPAGVEVRGQPGVGDRVEPLGQLGVVR